MVGRDDWRRDNPSWTIGLEKSSHFGGKKKPERRSLPPGQTHTIRPVFAGWEAAVIGKQRKIPIVQAFFWLRLPSRAGWGFYASVAAWRRLCTVKDRKVTAGCRKRAARRCLRHAPAMRDVRLSL
jgi:hypothetical protein